MKLNISYPETGLQKLIDIEDDNKLRVLYDKRISQEVEGDFLGEEFKGYRFRISGGNDKQGFPMKQGVLTTNRVRLLLFKGSSCYRQRRKGERKRKSVRGCIVSSELSVLSLVVVKKGEGEIPGLTDSKRDRRLGPKRASKIRKLFALGKTDDVRRYVVAYRRKIERPGKAPKYKAPKIQRLITPKVRSRRRRTIILKRRRVERGRKEALKYNALIAKRRKAKFDEEVRKGIRKPRRRTKSRLGSTASTGEKRKASEKKSTEDKPQKKQKKGQKSQKKGQKSQKKGQKGQKGKKTDKKKQPKKQKSQGKKTDKKAGGKGKKGKKK